MQRFSNILLVVNTEADNSLALHRAISLAQSNQAILTLCAAVDIDPGEMQTVIGTLSAAELRDIVINEKREKLDIILRNIAEKEISVEAKVLIGRPFIEIVRFVLRGNYDLVIKVARGASNFKDRLFGGTDMHLMRKCPCPVWIIKSNERQHYRRILAAVEKKSDVTGNNALNRQILEMSTSLALAEFGELHVVHAWRLFGESQLRSVRSSCSNSEVDAMVAKEADRLGIWLENLVNTCGANDDKDMVDYVKPQLHVIKGDAKSVVPAIARELNVDLVVMGTVARTGVAGFVMGNTAENILTQLDCSVLTVKPPGFVSPIEVKA